MLEGGSKKFENEEHDHACSLSGCKKAVWVKAKCLLFHEIYAYL